MARAVEADRPSGSRSERSTLVDLGFRVAFRLGHRALRSWWWFRRPHTRGAMVAVWHQGEVMIVKNSYRRHYSLPGGYIRSSETPSEAGARELAEEVAIEVDPSDVPIVYTARHPFEWRDDEVTILEVEVPERPTYSIDNREVVWAGFERPEAALALPMIPHVREYLERRL